MSGKNSGIDPANETKYIDEGVQSMIIQTETNTPEGTASARVSANADYIVVVNN